MILRHYDAYRRGDVAEIVRGWSGSGVLQPLPGGRVYVGQEGVERFLDDEINALDEFDFRVYTVLEQGEHALIFGRYSVRENGDVLEKGIFWIARTRGGKMASFEAFENVGEAFTAFKQRITQD